MLKHLAAGAVVLASLVIGLGAGAASADEAPHGFAEAFELPATNGYTATLIAAFDAELERGAAIIALHRKGRSVSYATRSATVNPDSVEARFGSLGEIDVHLATTGGKATERSECGGRSVSFPSARWEGTIRFRGEGGFVEVDASSAKAVVKPILNILCTDEINEGVGGRSPGALLELKRRHNSEALRLSVRKNKRIGPTRIRVEESERRGELEIDRAVSVVAPTNAFEFEIPPGHAMVEPPSPFSGSLSLTRHPGSSPAVKGNLKVDLPGREAVPILGPGHLRASLIRAVLNPSHPF
jgi:hypothetical protein